MSSACPCETTVTGAARGAYCLGRDFSSTLMHSHSRASLWSSPFALTARSASLSLNPRALSSPTSLRWSASSLAGPEPPGPPDPGPASAKAATRPSTSSRFSWLRWTSGSWENHSLILFSFSFLFSSLSARLSVVSLLFSALSLRSSHIGT